MGVSKKLFINLIILLVLITVGAVVYGDIKEDKEFKDKLVMLQTQEDLDEVNEVCAKKEYFAPYCKVADISLRLKNEEIVDVSECEEVTYNGAPYYLMFKKDEWKALVQEAKTTCEERLEPIDMEVTWDV